MFFGWLNFLYYIVDELIYIKKNKKFEKYKIFNYNTIKYRGINYRKYYNN